MDQAEQLRILKANDKAKPLARVITVTSGKGGVGKSNTSINLAIQMRKKGQRVIIIDADFGLANIEIMFGAVPKYNLFDLINQGKNIKDIITWGPMNVGFISGGSGIAGMADLSVDNLNCIVGNLVELDSLADTVIIDTGAGIGASVLEFLVSSGEVLLVTTPEPTSITDSYSLLKVLYKHPGFNPNETKVKMIANRVAKDIDGEYLFKKLNTVVEKYLKIPMYYAGCVPQDNQLTRAVIQQVPVSIQFPTSKSALAYEKIAAQLLDMESTERVSMSKRGIASFFTNIASKLRNE